MTASLSRRAIVLTFAIFASGLSAASPFVGRWALTLPDGRPGWLGVEEQGEQLAVSLLWGSGSVSPVHNVTVDGDRLRLIRTFKDRTGMVTRTILAERLGEHLQLATFTSVDGGTPGATQVFPGHRIADLPPPPDLAEVQFAPGIDLLSRGDLSDWEHLPAAHSGWTLQDGVLRNRVDKSVPGRWGNLRTKAVFGDFRLTAEVRTMADSNSGIYLRGLYEIQVQESYGRQINSHHMGALYSRLTPTVAAEKPIGEWQSLDITLVERHLTVILNGVTIIDNQPVLGCTGGALTSDETRPGPIMLQGDHSNIDYRNLVLHPVRN